LHAQATLDSQKREADTDAADQKGRLLSKTLGKMNRVLGISQGMSEVRLHLIARHLAADEGGRDCEARSSPIRRV
jgi:hypothetical protein